MDGRLKLRNSSADSVQVRLEPWGDERSLPRDETVAIKYSGPSGHGIEVEFLPGEIVVYAWEGAVMSFADAE
jgi:hypothetical protein